MSIVYTVTADFDDVSTAAEWVAWLKEGHMQQLLDGGATSAALVRLEPAGDSPLRFQVRYRFPSMVTFQRYEKEWAPRLRAEAEERFPAARGCRMSRRLAEVLFELPA